jgi:hypothetical protein
MDYKVLNIVCMCLAFLGAVPWFSGQYCGIVDRLLYSLGEQFSRAGDS